MRSNRTNNGPSVNQTANYCSHCTFQNHWNGSILVNVDLLYFCITKWRLAQLFADKCFTLPFFIRWRKCHATQIQKSKIPIRSSDFLGLKSSWNRYISQPAQLQITISLPNFNFLFPFLVWWFQFFMKVANELSWNYYVTLSDWISRGIVNKTVSNYPTIKIC